MVSPRRRRIAPVGTNQRVLLSALPCCTILSTTNGTVVPELRSSTRRTWLHEPDANQTISRSDMTIDRSVCSESFRRFDGRQMLELDFFERGRIRF